MYHLSNIFIVSLLITYFLPIHGISCGEFEIDSNFLCMISEINTSIINIRQLIPELFENQNENNNSSDQLYPSPNATTNPIVTYTPTPTPTVGYELDSTNNNDNEENTNSVLKILSYPLITSSVFAGICVISLWWRRMNQRRRIEKYRQNVNSMYISHIHHKTHNTHKNISNQNITHNIRKSYF